MYISIYPARITNFWMYEIKKPFIINRHECNTSY